ncbi:MAG TPA: HAMP domain-containing sensor histidine kinase [Casimicrobiaceae bacterium]|nr:HAMP domain-containing sensor histidine kinase [Casimicrobiaceae bacterium]
MYYPRSFLKFILLGFLLVSLPLLYALAELVLTLDRLATQASVEVQQAAQAARTSRFLFEQTTTLERVVRQNIILEDPALIDDYARVRQEFRASAAQLASLPLEPESRSAVQRLVDQESTLYKTFANPARGAEANTALADGYAKLVDASQATLAAANQLTQRAIERLQVTATRGRESWQALSVAAFAIALILAIVFAVLIARPIRQLDLAVRQMGSADFTHAVEVNGPQDLRYLGQRLEWLRIRLKELEDQQNRFLRHVSHELKTPLTAVREGAELLRDEVGGTLSRQQQDIVRIVRENTISLTKLIEDLLKYHQTRAMEPATLGPVMLADVVNRVVRDNKLAALARIVTFDLELAPVMITGDAERIRTIVDNMVTNAIKFSPRSSTIEVRLAAMAEEAVLDVADHGPGVAADEREKIFGSFYQGRAKMEGRVKGSGLGLAIAREYTLAHGGRIEARERADGSGGAVFRLCLPLAFGSARAAAAGARLTAAVAK